jgi:hypothetical protein
MCLQFTVDGGMERGNRLSVRRYPFRFKQVQLKLVELVAYDEESFLPSKL